MSKIAGINLGGVNDSFQIYGSQLGGRDETVIVNRASANFRRQDADELTKQVNLFAKEIRDAIENLRVLQEMMQLDEDADSVILDEGFIKEYALKVKYLGDKFEEMAKAVNK
jgi:hypothetical protein